MFNRKEYNKKWNEEHKEEVRVKQKIYNEKHKEELKECRHQCYLKNKEKHLLQVKMWKQNNPEKVKEYNKKYSEKHKNKIQEYGKEWYIENKEKKDAQNRKWKQEHPERVKELSYLHNKNNSEKKKAQRLKDRYGITLEEYSNLIKQQNNRCAICRVEFVTLNDKNIHLDHDHKNKKVRGILCHNCNLMIGNAKDTPENLNLGGRRESSVF